MEANSLGFFSLLLFYVVRVEGHVATATDGCLFDKYCTRNEK